MLTVYRKPLLFVTSFVASLVSCAPDQGSQLFSPSVVYRDTLAMAGTVDEQNPLFIYTRIAGVQLLDDSTVAIVDGGSAGRLIVANMWTGVGWEVSGGSGPGEFDGQQPRIFWSGGTLHTLTASGRYSERTLGGALLSTELVPSDSVFGFRSDISGFPIGVVDRRIVTHFHDAVDFESDAPQEIGQGIRIFDVDEGLVVDIREGLPSYTAEVVQNDDGSWTTREVTEQVGLAIAARHDLIVHAINDTQELIVRDPDGQVVATRDVGFPVLILMIDGNARIWAHVRAETESTVRGGRWIVLDRELNEQFRTVVNAQDAHDDLVLTMVRNRDLDHLSVAIVGR